MTVTTDANPSSLARKIVHGVLWTSLEAWGQQVALFAIFIVLARLVGPESLGQALIVLILPSIVTTALVKGLSDALVQRVQLEPAHLDSAFWLLVCFGSLFTVVFWFLGDTIAAAFSRSDLAEPARWASLQIILTCLMIVPAACIRRDLAFRKLAIRTFYGTLLGGSVGCALALAHYGVWSLLAMQIVRSAVEATYLLATSKWRPRLEFSLAKCRDLVPVAAPSSFVATWSNFNDELPKMIVGALLGATQVGIYGLARRPLEFLSSVLLGPISLITMPVVARLQTDPERTTIYYVNAVRITSLIGFPAFTGLAAIAPDLVPLLLGESWRDSISAIQIVMLLGLVRTVDGVAGGVAVAHGYSAIILYFSLAYSVIATALLVAASPFGLEATMLAIVVANAVLLPPFLLVVRQRTGVAMFLPLICFPRIIAATAAMIIAVLSWQMTWRAALPASLLVATAAGVGLVTYTAIALLLLRKELGELRSRLLARSSGKGDRV